MAPLTYQRLTYLSTSTIARGNEEREIGEILRVARARNPQLDLTGVLIFNGHQFAQVLEGPPASMEEVFEHIQRDMRHDNVIVLEKKDAQQRIFDRWSMGFIGSKEASEAFRMIVAQADVSEDELKRTDVLRKVSIMLAAEQFVD